MIAREARENKYRLVSLLLKHVYDWKKTKNSMEGGVDVENGGGYVVWGGTSTPNNSLQDAHFMAPYRGVWKGGW